MKSRRVTSERASWPTVRAKFSLPVSRCSGVRSMAMRRLRWGRGMLHRRGRARVGGGRLLRITWSEGQGASGAIQALAKLLMNHFFMSRADAPGARGAKQVGQETVEARPAAGRQRRQGQ